MRLFIFNIYKYALYLYLIIQFFMHARSRKLYVYFKTIRGAWIGRRMHPDPLLGSRIPVRQWIQTALEQRAKIENFNFCAQTAKICDTGLGSYSNAQSPADSDGVISFLSRAADPGSF
eukprot:COSAG05_NODE_14_length_36349_cov_27.641655_8_plen_118_part_00